MKRACTAVAAAALAAAIVAGPAQAQTFTKTGFTEVGFTSLGDIKGESLDGLLAALREHTVLAGETRRPTRIVFVYGIGHGDRVFDPVVSNPVLLVPGQKPYIERGGGPLSSPWDAYQDPLLGFEDPALGFEDPALGFEEPSPVRLPRPEGSDARANLEAIWGTGNVGVDPGDYGLVLFTMPDPSAPGSGGDGIAHSAALASFEVSER